MDEGIVAAPVQLRKPSVTATDAGRAGKFFLAPEITQDDLDTLRAGGRLPAREARGIVSATVDGQEYQFLLKMRLQDFGGADSPFFGDRALDNPGYSAFTLNGNVGTGQQRNPLDVWRVEQRLKYLGYPGMGYGNPTPTNNVIQDFTVDGKFEDKEQRALKLFEKVVRGETIFDTNANGADGLLTTSDTISLSWLNAYNAPHWMDIGSEMQYQNSRPQSAFSLPAWNNTQKNSTREHTDVEIYGTSLLRDLMQARNFAQTDFVAGLPVSGSRFTGAIDANLGVTLNNHHQQPHGLGMNFDLSIFTSYLTGTFLTAAAAAGPVIDANLASRPASTAAWSNQYAVDLSGQLLNGAVDRKNKNLQRDALRDFLALYSVTRNNGTEANGWDDLLIANGTATEKEAIRKALFGDGSASGSLISKVFIGGDSSNGAVDIPTDAKQAEHQRMRDALKALGISNNNSSDHHNHFHVNLRPPKPVSIGGSLLLAAGPASTATDAGNLLAAQAPAQSQYDAVMSVCGVIAASSEPKVASEYNGIDPLAAAQAYFHARGTDLNIYQDPRLGLPLETFKETLLEGPRHGELRDNIYYPNEGYVGPDQMTFSVEVKGKKFKVIYSVYPGTPEYPPDECPGGFQIKELPSGGTGGKGSSLDILELPTEGPVSPEKLAEFHATLSFSFGFGFLGLTGLFGFAGGRVSFQNLEGGALGKTEGNSIILDDDAAGHGWFVDATPMANEEFDPTSSPWEFRANAGIIQSAARCSDRQSDPRLDQQGVGFGQ